MEITKELNLCKTLDYIRWPGFTAETKINPDIFSFSQCQNRNMTWEVTGKFILCKTKLLGTHSPICLEQVTWKILLNENLVFIQKPLQNRPSAECCYCFDQGQNVWSSVSIIPFICARLVHFSVLLWWEHNLVQNNNLTFLNVIY